ncbi:hypothetical protein PAHAL_3G313500 [Panicum hallii]|uniref:Uncharacterized protein n=1 Tax=Panicum hallii TaxID=206008 RepID=A0A2S3HD66_9POAL|nr:hypothetical protein PAHAL_3G313500 [Panicum hallii]
MGNPNDIAAMMAVRGPPEKKAKKTKTTESSIVPLEDEAPAASMSFPPSIEATSKKKGKNSKSSSGALKRSRTDSNQPKPLSIEIHVPTEQTDPVKKKTKRKVKEPSKKKNAAIPMLSLESPAIPAMSTRRKRRLGL